VWTDVSWKGEGVFSPWLIDTFWEYADLTQSTSPFKSALSVIVLTAVRNRDDEVYLMTASCWKQVTKGPAASGLTTRRVIEGTTIVSYFHLHKGHL
jgi:hypothetical protein